jgi:O-antigen/teichoic acid export membrane protein
VEDTSLMSIRRYASYNLAGAIVPLAVSLVTVPLYLKVIGLDRYGVLAICWVLVGYFGLFDLGIGRATAQKIATLADSAPEERSRCFWTGATLSSCMAAAGLLIFTPLAYLGTFLIKLPNAELYAEFHQAVPLLVAALPFGFAQSLLGDTLQGRNEFFKANAITITGTVATAVVPLVTAMMVGPQLVYVLASVLAVRVLVLLLLIAASVRAIPIHRARFGGRAEAVALLKFGGWLTISNIVGPLLVFTDRFAIGAILGSAAVSLYTVPYNVAWQITIIPSALSSALFPRFASAAAGESKSLIAKAVSALSFLITPAIVAAALLAPPFLVVWLGHSTGTRSAPVACILFFGLWANTFGRVTYSHLQASGRPDLISMLLLAELLPYFAMLYFGMRWMGLPGAALAWSVRCLIDTVGLFVMDEAPVPNFGRLSAQALLVVVAIGASLEMPIWSLGRLAATVILLALVLALVWRDRPAELGRLFLSNIPAQFLRRRGA